LCVHFIDVDFTQVSMWGTADGLQGQLADVD